MSATWDGLVTTRAGWTCPECRTVYSPDVKQCECARVAPSFAERLGQPPALRRPGNCTCNTSWNSTLPPPPCPVHGQTLTVVLC